MYAPPPGFLRLRLAAQWDGRDFVGWQSQARGRSVQDTLHGALLEFMEAARPVAAGRTDAGVHALRMPLHVDVKEGSLKPPLGRLNRALNGVLSPDLAILSAEAAPPGFHARFSCSSRSYLYRILRSEVRFPLEENRALRVAGPLDVGAMRKAAAGLIGRHDFAAFATREERQTVRELFWLELREVGPILELHLSGESFLRHMVRAVVGTLLLVGAGKLGPEEVAVILAAGQRERAGANVPAHGLYFAGAGYGDTLPR